MAGMRLDKVLAYLHCGSRKEVQALIRAGRVTVNQATIRDPAYKTAPGTDQITVDGQVQVYQAQRYFMLNKPAGVITASRDDRRQTVLDLFPAEERRGLFAVGRLDRDTEGLLLITDDGAFSHALMSPGRHVEKEYSAEIEGTLAPDAVEQFRAGLLLRDGTRCLPATLEPSEDGHRARVILCEGKYHQVKRMLAAAGGKVVRLKRVRLGALTLDPALAPGAFRPLQADELARLREASCAWKNSMP